MLSWMPRFRSRDFTVPHWTAVLIVADQGVGIDPADHKRIFGRFERAVPVRHYGGLGLGLFIVRQIVDSLGGRITVHSTPGEGSTFQVDMPLQPTHPEGAVAEGLGGSRGGERIH